jgi:hypothetical protein
MPARYLEVHFRRTDRYKEISGESIGPSHIAIDVDNPSGMIEPDVFSSRIFPCPHPHLNSRN